MWKKMILSVALLFLVTFVLFIYNEFNGNPISKYRAEKALQSYLAETYPDKVVRIKEEGFYDFKFKEYLFKVTEVGAETPEAEEVGEEEEKIPNIQDHQFAVTGFIIPRVKLDGMRMGQLDHSLMERLGREASIEIFELLDQTVGNIHAVEVTMEVLKGQFENGVSWDKSLPLDRPFSIFIVLNSSNQETEDIYESAVLIQKTLAEANYNYEWVNINGNVINDAAKKDGLENGYVKYGLGFDKDEQIKRQKIKEF
jgi:hypothetical protein